MLSWIRFFGRRLVATSTLLGIAIGASLPPALVSGQGSPNTAPPARGVFSQGPFLLRSQTNVVLVDVRVRDKSGKLVTDLTQKDFRVWEDGVLQKLTSFSLEDVEKLAQAEAVSGLPPIIDLGKLPPNVNPEKVLENRRLTVLFFDVSSMQPDDLIRSLKAAEAFVRNKLTPADLVAVVAYTSSLRVLQNFTNDRTTLDGAIKGILMGEESSSLSSLGTVGEAGGTDA